jgi:hypothetical protein
VYRLADPIRVRVVRVNPDERKIDFEPALSQPVQPGRVGDARKPARRNDKGGRARTARTGNKRKAGGGKRNRKR